MAHDILMKRPCVATITSSNDLTSAGAGTVSSLVDEVGSRTHQLISKKRLICTCDSTPAAAAPSADDFSSCYRSGTELSSYIVCFERLGWNGCHIDAQ